MARLRHFSGRPRHEKAVILGQLMRRARNRISPRLPLPVRLPWGFWWLAWNDICGDAILRGTFEPREQRFTERFLRSGMSVLDIGAHHGFYTLMASDRVGPRGHVVAFEPSPRERRRLLWHVRLNRCTNVRVEATALGGRESRADLFMVTGRQTGCNSLRPPDVNEGTRVLQVPVVTLDTYMVREKMAPVDFIKIDVEGAELEVLSGAQEFLRREPRPVILCEVQDLRTRPWGYKAEEILICLSGMGFSWFEPALDGTLEPIAARREHCDGNFVAVPAERLEEIRALVRTAPPALWPRLS